MTSPGRTVRGTLADRRGREAEQVACIALEAEGWTVLGRRLRTAAGEVDLVARRADFVAFIEVKARPTLTQAAWSLTARQRQRLLLAAETLLAENPAWQAPSMRFDVMLVDSAGRVRRIADAFRAETVQGSGYRGLQLTRQTVGTDCGWPVFHALITVADYIMNAVASGDTLNAGWLTDPEDH